MVKDLFNVPVNVQLTVERDFRTNKYLTSCRLVVKKYSPSRARVDQLVRRVPGPIRAHACRRCVYLVRRCACKCPFEFTGPSATDRSSQSNWISPVWPARGPRLIHLSENLDHAARRLSSLAISADSLFTRNPVSHRWPLRRFFGYTYIQGVPYEANHAIFS